jgi:anti-anti-sigma factor
VALTISSQVPYPGLTTLSLAGELDLASATALGDAITEAVKSAGVDAILIDLQELTFLDSTGIGVLVAGWRMATESGKQLRIDNAHGMARRVLTITGVWSSLAGDPGPD